MPNDHESTPLKVREAAQIGAVSAQSIRELVRRGKLRKLEFGTGRAGRILISRRSFYAWLEGEKSA